MLKRVIALLLFSANLAHADVIIGVGAPLSGQSQALGQSMLNGVKGAVDKINASGGLGHEQVSITSADDQCDTVKSREAADKLVAANVDVVIGHFCSTSALEAAKIYEKAGIAMIAPTANAPALTESGLSNVLRLSTRIDAQGAFAAARIKAKRPNAKLAVVDDGSAEMKAIVTSFTSTYAKAPTLSASFAPDQKDFSELITKMKAAGIDTLYLAAQAPDAGRLTAQVSKAGLDVKRYGPDALLSDAFWAASGPSGEATLVSFPLDPQSSSEAKALARDMKALGQETDGPFLPAYGAVELFTAAAQTAGAHDHRKIIEMLKSGASFPTLLGPLKFDTKGDGQDLRFNWYSWNNGVYQTIAPESP